MKKGKLRGFDIGTGFVIDGQLINGLQQLFGQVNSDACFHLMNIIYMEYQVNI